MTEENYLSKKDIMRMYDCESDKALRILKLMYNIKYAFKVGKQYYTTAEYNKQFFELYKGKSVIV